VPVTIAASGAHRRSVATARPVVAPAANDDSPFATRGGRLLGQVHDPHSDHSSPDGLSTRRRCSCWRSTIR
jgi:hypothetical protein